MTQQEILNEEYETTGEVKNLSFSSVVLCDLLSSALAEGKIEFITEEDEQRLLELDSSNLDDSQLYEEFNKLFGTNYVKDIGWKVMTDEEDIKPADVVLAPVAFAGVGESDEIKNLDVVVSGEQEVVCVESDEQTKQSDIEAKAKELVDIICSDDVDTDTFKSMAAAVDFLKILPDDSLAIKVPVIEYVKNDLEPNKEYIVMDKELINKLITENKEVCAVISKMTSDMGIKVTGLGLDSQVKAILKLWFSLKANTKNVDKIVVENTEQKATIKELNNKLNLYTDVIRESGKELENLQTKLNKLGNVDSLEKPRYVVAFIQPKTNTTVWLTKPEEGNFGPTNFSATRVLFDAFKFGDLETVRKFLDLLIENVGKHGIPEQYLSNIKVQEIMIKDC